MQVFITGATGFIGGYLVRRLAADGYRLRCLVRPGSRTAVLDACGTEKMVGDVLDRAALQAGMIGCDAVVHLANLYSFWERDKAALHRINVDGTRRVMEAALAAGARQVIHVSSVVVFGKPWSLPFNEESKPGPHRFSQYAQTKYQGDQLARALRDQRGLPLTVLYPAGVLGPGDPQASGRYIRDLLERRLPLRVFPRSKMSWVDVRDVVEAIVQVLPRQAPGEEYILSGPAVSMADFNDLIRAIGGVRLPRWTLPYWLSMPTAHLLTAWAWATGKPPLWGMAADSMRTLKQGIDADGTAAARALGFAYRPLRQTLEDTIAAFN